MSGDVLREVLAVLDEVKRLDDAQTARTERMRDLAKQARKATNEVERADLRRRAMNESIAVVDYGDVWERIKALRPKVQKALKNAPAPEEPCL